MPKFIVDLWLDGYESEEEMEEACQEFIYEQLNFAGSEEMKLRWLIRRNNVTATEVREYAQAHEISMMQARDELIKETRPVLQYHTVLGGWQDVPTVILPYDS